MKILLVKSYPKLTSIRYLAKGLKRMGHDIDILVPRDHADCEEMRRDGIKVHIIDFMSWKKTTLRGIWGFVKTIKKVVKLLKANRYDIVNLNLGMASLIGRIASLFLRKKIIISTIRGSDMRYERWTNWIDDLTLTVSYTRREYLIANGLSEKKLAVIHNGIDIEEADAVKEDKFYLHKELGLAQEVRLIGMVAYFYYNKYSKGHNVFLDAAQKVSKKFPDIKFVMVGSDVYKMGWKKYFEGYAQAIGLKDRVYFLGERDDVLSIMSSLYLHVLPSLNEGCPMVLLEAMSRKIPNIASRIRSIEEIIDDRISGVLFEPSNSDSLAKAIIFLLNNPDEAQRIGLEGRRRLEGKFTAKDMAYQYDNLFKQLSMRKKWNRG